MTLKLLTQHRVLSFAWTYSQPANARAHRDGRERPHCSPFREDRIVILSIYFCILFVRLLLRKKQSITHPERIFFFIYSRHVLLTRFYYIA
ncbi:hypothetical protein F4801DRAFT_230167 [Xylaria longipes]|nr:hypothetical protein F4801DRAFT_230167 [Xylaria longipes]